MIMSMDQSDVSRHCTGCGHDCQVAQVSYLSALEGVLIDARNKRDYMQEHQKVDLLKTGAIVGLFASHPIKSLTQLKLKKEGYSEITCTIGGWGAALLTVAASVGLFYRQRNGI